MTPPPARPTPTTPATLSTGTTPATPTTPTTPTTGVDYHAVFAALPAPKLVLGPDGTVLDVNAAFRAAFGEPAVLGRPLADVLPEPGRREVLASVRAAARTGRPQTVGPVPSPAAGGPRWWLLTTTPTTGPGRRVTALVLRAAEVTEVMPGPDGPTGRPGAGARAVVDALVEAVGIERAEAEVLHDSLLTELPAVPGLALDVRYRPAHARSPVGGDWYDAFVQPSGQAVLVVGDVTGHDVAAAARMRQLRGTLRTLGYAEDAGPAETLRRTERTLAGLGCAVTATVLVVAVAPGGRELRWASAGHLPPVLVRADGSAVPLRGAPELLLGVDPGAARSDRSAALGPGETLLAFTDGLVERRGESVARGLERLVATLPDIRRADGTLDLDELLVRCCPGDGDDDVTVLTARRLPADEGA
ncbi:PP2C family protein-serine/threonine phosphatase [Cellulomonas pakistanensis]|uniref:PPM-type phosphatase domain-containing protein n=1 Tax=Cellulomonas pakistanensis TaxID=992287 RepID=A0A919P7M0_9CELL|nr:SpoIIE family protein phosphatase [Cellulomonas pakistanensis]GIG35571.1 hypothetical protein Cpa01nite_09520 [Cellulomonas pakistanensis]